MFGVSTELIWLALLQQLYRKYFSTLPSESIQLVVPAPPQWESDETRKRKSESSVGNEVVTEEDRSKKFVRTKKVTVSNTSPGKDLSTSNGQTTTASDVSTAPVYQAPLYIPPTRQEQRPAKRR